MTAFFEAAWPWIALGIAVACAVTFFNRKDTSGRE